MEVEDTLDRNFFSVRFNPLPKGEKEYLKALASLGPGEHTQAEVATAMGKADSKSTGARVSRLSEKGIIYKLADGKVSFTIPHLERYVMRNF